MSVIHADPIQTTQRLRYHNAPASQTGPLGDPSTTPNARVLYAAAYPDALGRTVAAADYGTNGGTALVRPATVPSSSSTVLVTLTAYNTRGEAYQTTDPAGRVDQTVFDDAGRQITLIENYVGADPVTPDQNRTTRWTYTADGAVATIVAVNAATGNQETRFLYGTTLGNSDIATSTLKRYDVYPDSVSGSDRVAYGYNRQQQVTSQTDQNGTVHSFSFDLLGRQTQDAITTLGTGVDAAVLRIETAYEVRGMIEKLTSINNATVGEGTVVNQTRFVFNDFSQVVTDYQEHAGAVDTSTSLNVQYGFADGSANTIRPTSLIYPSGRVLTFAYGTSGGMADVLSRIASFIDNDGTTHLADYSYLGASTVIKVDHAQPQVEFTLISVDGGDDPDTGDIYGGFDRFGRIKDNRWYNYGASTAADRIQYGYDQAGNRLWRENTVAKSLGQGFDELYSYDGLYRLATLQRGTLTDGDTAIANMTFAQDWSLDATGNWSGFEEDDTGDGAWDLVQTRTANTVNEITGITNTAGPAWPTPAYDGAGNTTNMPEPNALTQAFTATYDAWNRLVKLVDQSTGDTVQENVYDGRGFRIIRNDYTGGVLTAARHTYLTDQWQDLEERLASGGVISSNPERQFVWGPRYIDDLVLRDRDTTGDGTLNERLYGLQDANWNTTAVTDSSGNVQERYAYSAYGQVAFLSGEFTDPSGISAFAMEDLYTGRKLDAVTGLFYYRARYYHPGVGVFLSRDPVGLSLRDTNSHTDAVARHDEWVQFLSPAPLFRAEERTLYGYADNNPAGATDPGGEQAQASSSCPPWQQKCKPGGPGYKPLPPPPNSPPQPGQPCDYPNRLVSVGLLSWESQCVCQCAGNSPGMNCVRGCLKCVSSSGAPPTVPTELFCRNGCNLTAREHARLSCCLNNDWNNGGCAGSLLSPPRKNPNPNNASCTGMKIP